MFDFLFLQVDSTLNVSGGAESLSVIELIMKGGVVMIPILILSVATIYIIVERFIYIRKASAIDDSMMKEIGNMLRSGNLEAAIMLARSKDAPAARIVEKGLSRLGKGSIKDVEATVEAIANIEVKKMERNMGYLGIFSGIAPMLGFIGTIIGIIVIFYNIAVADNISIGLIAGGLYQKMITSCAGLIVGVIAYSGYHFLNGMIDRFLLRIETFIFEFIEMLQS